MMTRSDGDPPLSAATHEGGTVDETTARALIALDNRFYADHADSFSATRTMPWPGWDRVLDLALERGALGEAPRRSTSPGSPWDEETDPEDEPEAPSPRRAPRVLDVACGNMRFERYLLERIGRRAPRLFTVDNCDQLSVRKIFDPADLPAGMEPPRHMRADVLERMLDGHAPLLGIPPCSLTVCFGFMHHVPGEDLRARLMRVLVNATAPGGLVALSFWRFMDDERLARKTRSVEARAARRRPFSGFSPRALEPGDHLLDWQADEFSYRYCHYADEAELDRLIKAAGPVREIERFSADGSSGALNRYVILQRVRETGL